MGSEMCIRDRGWCGGMLVVPGGRGVPATATADGAHSGSSGKKQSLFYETFMDFFSARPHKINSKVLSNV